MNAYLDTSVIVRELLHQAPALREWSDLVLGVTSQLARIECFRTIDRIRIAESASDEAVANLKQRADSLFGRFDVLPLMPEILARAAEPFESVVSTLDALHLSTALAYRGLQRADEPPIYFATFDVALAKAARATGFDVLGA